MLASSLAIGGLALVGLTAHEVGHEGSAASDDVDSTKREATLAAAA